MVRRGDIAREVALVASLSTRDDIVQPLGAWLGAARGPGVALPFEDRVSLTDHAGGGKGALYDQDRAALVALASALIALVWPLLESTGSGCPLGYGANETVARSFHDVPGTSSRVQNATVFARCAMWNVDGEERDVIVSPSGRIVAVERSGKRRGEDETIVDCAGRVLASGFSPSRKKRPNSPAEMKPLRSSSSAFQRLLSLSSESLAAFSFR